MIRRTTQVLAAVAMIALSPWIAAQVQVPPQPPFPRATAQEDAAAILPRFDLDFPGGTPKDLVLAIEKASGTELSVIIPPDSKGLVIPPLRMIEVNVRELFEALRAASRRLIVLDSPRAVPSPSRGSPAGTSYASSFHQYEYGFATENPRRDHKSVWVFQEQKPVLPSPEPPPVAFYQLAPYLDQFSVEDITTAIQTGWKLAGTAEPLTLKFHPETKLLIVSAPQSAQNMINTVLQQLTIGQRRQPAIPARQVNNPAPPNSAPSPEPPVNK